MAIDVRKGSHVSSFPTLISSMMNTYKRVYNIVLTADTDNGMLAARGNYVSFDNYQQAAVTNDAVTVAVRELGADGLWICEVTVLPDTEVLYLYNSPVSEYPQRELQDESLFYNKKGDLDYAILLWNEGCSAMDRAKRKTKYYNTVMSVYEKL